MENSLVGEFYNEISDIRFKNVDDFISRRETIREKAKLLTDDFREIYKWYFYHQLCLLSQKQFELKDLMWLYTNGENVESELLINYKLFCEKRQKVIDNDKIIKLKIDNNGSMVLDK